MVLTLITEVILSILIVSTALLAIEARDSIRAISSFAAMNLVLSTFFLILQAPYVAVFQLLVYFGVALFLLFVVVGLGEKKKGPIKGKMLLPGLLFGFLLAVFLVILSLSMPIMPIVGYESISLSELSGKLWDTYENILLVTAYIVAFSTLGSLSLISLKEGKK